MNASEATRENRIVHAKSGEELRYAEGTYDVGIFYEDGSLRVNRWLSGVSLKGKMSEAVEIGGSLATVTVTAIRGEAPLPGAWYGLFRPGDHGQPLATAQSGQPLRTTAETYDIGCFFSEGGITAQSWRTDDQLSGTVELSMEIQLQPASLTIRAAPAKRADGAVALPTERGANVILILDASGSMWARTESSTRMEVAREVLADVIRGLPDADLNVGLWIYGANPRSRGDCDDVRRVHSLGPVDKPALLAAIAGVRPRAWTPIAKALDRAAEDLTPGANNSIVLVTDGIESCRGDPCATARTLAARGVSTGSFVVGFGVTKDKARFLECIGRYYPAQNRTELSAALKDALTESVKPLTGMVIVRVAGSPEKVVAHGTFDQKLVFPAGTYDITIKTSGREIRWSSVPIRGDVVSAPAESPPAR